MCGHLPDQDLALHLLDGKHKKMGTCCLYTRVLSSVEHGKERISCDFFLSFLGLRLLVGFLAQFLAQFFWDAAD